MNDDAFHQFLCQVRAQGLNLIERELDLFQDGLRVIFPQDGPARASFFDLDFKITQGGLICGVYQKIARSLFDRRKGSIQMTSGLFVYD